MIPQIFMQLKSDVWIHCFYTDFNIVVMFSLHAVEI